VRLSLRVTANSLMSVRPQARIQSSHKITFTFKAAANALPPALPMKLPDKSRHSEERLNLSDSANLEIFVISHVLRKRRVRETFPLMEFAKTLAPRLPNLL